MNFLLTNTVPYNFLNNFTFLQILIAAEQCGAEEICLNCHDPKSLAAGLSDSVKLSRFFDKVIERKFYTRDTGGFLEKRKYITPQTSPYLMSMSGYDERSGDYKWDQ